MIPWFKDEKRDYVRLDFLRRVITASLESIHQETTVAASFSSTQAILWISKCQNLASIWKINNDELRIHQVCQMYINGFDRLAEEVLINYFLWNFYFFTWFLSIKFGNYNFFLRL